MHLVRLSLILSVYCLTGSTTAFSAVSQCTGVRCSPLWGSTVGNNLSEQEKKVDNQVPPDKDEEPVKMSEAIPFLPVSRVLASSNFAGNFGFDPLGLANSEEQLLVYREAEVKHGRLAMLVSALLFTSGLMDGTVVDRIEMLLGIPLTMEQLELEELQNIFSSVREIPQFWGFCVGLTASSDLYGLAKAESGDPNYFPGNLGFDPLGLYPTDEEGQKRMQLAEIKHGRVAMIAISVIVFQGLMEFLFEA